MLTREQYLVNGLGDLLEDSRMLRNQIKAGLDAGIGKMYLEQIQGYGTPDALFNGRVKRVLTENIGFSEKAAGEWMRRFDEMIGWRALPAARKKSLRRSGSGKRSPLPIPSRK